MNYAGRGCPLQGVSVIPSDVPELGPGIPLSWMRSSCAINLDYIVPDGWQIAVSHVGMKAVTTLSKEVDAMLSTQTYFSGQADKILKHETLVKGPRDSEDIVVDNSPETPTWSACGGQQTLALLWSARLKGPLTPGGTGSVEFFYDMSEPLQTVDLIWQSCDAPLQ